MIWMTVVSNMQQTGVALNLCFYVCEESSKFGFKCSKPLQMAKIINNLPGKKMDSENLTKL